MNQLNWRGDNKIAHLQGAAPFLSPDQLEGPNGVQIYKDSVKDFSILPNLPPPKVRPFPCLSLETSLTPE